MSEKGADSSFSSPLPKPQTAANLLRVLGITDSTTLAHAATFDRVKIRGGHRSSTIRAEKCVFRAAATALSLPSQIGGDPTEAQMSHFSNLLPPVPQLMRIVDRVLSIAKQNSMAGDVRRIALSCLESVSASVLPSL
eukprot:IDg22746t1